MANTVADGRILLGHAHDEPVLITRRGDQWFAVGAKCTHYGGPLADGLVVGETIRCPWHQEKDAAVHYYLGDQLLAVATVGRDKYALEVARRFEQE